MSCHHRVPEVPPEVQTESMHPVHISAPQSYQKALHISVLLRFRAFYYPVQHKTSKYAHSKCRLVIFAPSGHT